MHSNVHWFGMPFEMSPVCRSVPSDLHRRERKVFSRVLGKAVCHNHVVVCKSFEYTCTKHISNVFFRALKSFNISDKLTVISGL